MKRRWIGHVTVLNEGPMFLAECGKCSWRLRKKRRDDAESLLKSHNRIAHPPTYSVYMEEEW